MSDPRIVETLVSHATARPEGERPSAKPQRNDDDDDDDDDSSNETADSEESTVTS